MQLSFTFPLTFANPVLSFAFRAGTVRLLDLQASFTVDATVTATAQLARTGGTLVLQSLGECQQLAEQLAGRGVASGADLSGTRVLVTGGTSGLGLAMARALAGAAATVALTGRHAERAGWLRQRADRGTGAQESR